MSNPDKCSRCGRPLPCDAPEGRLCPQCLLKIGMAATGSSPGPAPRDDLSDRVPETIGPYRILDKLGEGGMGVVYVAEQTEPVRRRVALKLIKLGMDTKQVIARFEAERQALALMNHPNVAKVFDAGATDSGRPYFVMEYVPGIPITEYCDLRCLPVRERLELFIQVCEAIHHAHQKGIIHRDMKPSNVLVSSEEGKPSLKVIDFGVAKATSQRLTERTLYTQHGILIGTPEYMSPEQAQTTALDVDTRTDIYSLGVLLYELLVGALPFDPRTLRRAATVEMLRIIREEDPPRPTVKFGSLGDTANEVARRRHADIPSLSKQLKGELEWITMRALEKNPARRYGSVSEFAADVRRHLDDEPVMASPPSRAYRLRKLVRKNRGPVAAALALLTVLTAAAVFSTAMYLRSEAARKLAEAEALRNKLDTEALSAFLLDDVQGYRDRTLEALRVHREMLAPDDPEYAAYLVNRLHLLGGMYAFDVEPTPHDLIIELEREALEAVKRALPSGDPNLIDTLDLLINAHDEWDDAKREWACREALALRRETLPPDDASMIVNLETLSHLVDKRGMASRAQGDAAEADRLETEAMDLQREALQLRRASSEKIEPAIGEVLVRLAGILDRRGSRLLEAAEPAAAEPFLRGSLQLLQEEGQTDSRRAAGLQCRLGRCLTALEHFPEAEALLLDGYRIFEGELGGKSASVQMAANALIELYEKWNRPAEAERYRSLLTSPTVLSIRELGPLQFPGKIVSSMFHGRNGGYSTLFSGRSLWAFDFSIANPECETGRGNCSASWSWTDDLDASDGIGAFSSGTDLRGFPAEPIPYTEDEAAYNRAHRSEDCVEDCNNAYYIQPASLVSDPARGRALVFYQKRFGSDVLFDAVRQGTSIAVWTDPTQRAVRPAAGGTVTELFSAEEPAWGSAAVVADDLLYAYACQPERDGCPILVARAPLADALDRRAWRFYAGDRRWSADWREAIPVTDCGGYLSIHWNEHLGRYLASHVDPEGGGRAIALRTADRPEGPWSEPLLYIVGVPPPEKKGGTLKSGLIHPEFAREGGRIEYITYFRPTDVHIFGGETRLVEITFR